MTIKTIKDIAEEAMVSTGTVDRVIHNRPGVSLKTREKVQKILTKYNFQRNIIASTLASKKKFTIATLIPHSKSSNEFWFEPKKGIKEASKEIKQYGVDVHHFYFNLFDPESFYTEFNKIIDTNPNAVLLAPIFYKTSQSLVKQLDKKKIPYIFINTEIESLKNVSFVGQNSYQSGFLSGKILNLILPKSSNILVIESRKHQDKHYSIDSRVKGFMDFFNKKKSSRIINILNIDSFKLKEIEKNLKSELIYKKNFKGIFVPSSYVYKVAKYFNYKGIKSFKLIGYDIHKKNITQLKNESIDFLIDQEPYEQGYKGIKILFDLLLLNKNPKQRYNSPINIITKENLDFRVIHSQ